MMIKARKADTIPMHEPWKLPREWEWVHLRNILTLAYGRALPTKKRDSRGVFPVFGSGGQAGSHSSAITRSPVIVIGRKGSIGSLFFSDEPCWPIDTTYYIDNFSANINPKYIYYFLKVLGLENLNRAAAIPGLNREDVYASVAPIPFPDNYIRSLDIQHRIISRIEASLADLKEAQESLNGMRRDIDQVMESVLKEMFEDFPKSATDWGEKRIADLCYNPQYGYTQSATFEPVGPKFLRITDIQNGNVDWGTVPYCRIPPKRLSTYQLQRGDLLFARSGATTGKTFLIRECPTAVFASYLIRLRVREGISPELLGWFFKSRAYWDQVRPRGGALPNMNAPLLRNVKVRYPLSSQTQQQVVNDLDSIQDDVNKMQKTLEEDEALLQQIEQSILNQAFRGEL